MWEFEYLLDSLKDREELRGNSDEFVNPPKNDSVNWDINNIITEDEIKMKYNDIKHIADEDEIFMNPPKNDSVNHPFHYIHGQIETIDVIKEWTNGLSGIDAVCIGNVIKYISRWQEKGGVEDLKKARWYLNRVIMETEGKI